MIWLTCIPSNMTMSRSTRTPVVLIVLDGWGFRPGREGNAIELGKTPVWHKLWERASRTLVEASGLAVGLPDGQIGNSEVGHLNLGAGRVVPQDIVRISQSIERGEFFRIPALVQLVDETRRHDATLHVMGLIGTGGVHALDKHLLAVVELGRKAAVPVAIHAWLDGRDTPPKSALGFMQELLQAVGPSGRPTVSTVIGRYYAMDRDKRWDRTKLAYDAMVKGIGVQAADPVSAIKQAYAAGETDEFVKPRVISGAPLIKGGYEPPYKGEERLLVPSQKVATYDLMPEMSAPGVTDVLCKAIAAKQHDFILCNYANGDMVGHSGVLAAAVKAVETVDSCLARVLTTADTAGGGGGARGGGGGGATVMVTADHGNCELMIDPATGGPHTAHTTNPVPFVIVGEGAPTSHLRAGGSLRDVGPTILRLLDIEPPKEMTGKDLRETD